MEGAAMRVGVLCLLLLVVATAHAQRNRGETEATQRACGVEDCLLERDIRDFEIIDRTHVIVYTGSQRCAFYIEVRGTHCDLTFAPELYFSRLNELPDGTQSSADDPLESTFGNRMDLSTSSSRNLRICSNDLGIQVHGGQFTESAPVTASTDRFGNVRAECRIAGVRSITDDQLVEFYVQRRVIPPLPPMGVGQIEVGEQDEEGADAEAEPEPERNSRRGRRAE
jgi:hypothetical protein